jgi:hypothetical protein
MGHIFTDYRPEKVWQYFEAITKIPRRSGNEAGMSDYLLAFAKDRGLVAYRDEYFNTRNLTQLLFKDILIWFVKKIQISSLILKKTH